MTYQKQEWRNNDRSTPLSAERLLHMEEGIATAVGGAAPHIENGNWWVGETDTGVRAVGIDGIDGATPHIENGNWWVGDTDTGVRAAGIDGIDGINGVDGKDGKDGKDASGGGIIVVSSEEEAAALPIGTVYVIAPGEPTPVTIVGTVGENITTATFTPTIPNATTGDTIIIAANTKAVSGPTITAPAGFTTLVDGYWKGTQRSWVFSGPWSEDLTITTDQPLEFAYAAVAVRGARYVTTGMVKDREMEPTESTTVTAPAVAHGTNDLVIGIAFERTTSDETPGQVTVNAGWTIEHYTAQGMNIQTVLIGVGGTGDMVVTYPNAQATNGVGVQVVAYA